MTDADPGLLSIFADALEQSDPAARAAYLDRACGGNAALRKQVEALLAAHAGAGRFLEPDPAGGAEATDTLDPEPHHRNTRDFRPAGGTGTFPGTLPAGGAPAVALGTVIAGRYTLVEVIGEGGMGTVYQASQTEPVKRQVALKLIKSGMDTKVVLARFDAERQALALMDHPNIARIYDGGVTDRGQPFFVMELVKGVPITEYCDQKQLPVKTRLELFVSACQAVQHAHQKGIIHRDLKPGNVLVTEVDGRPTPKVIDFGVAKATEQKLTDMSFVDTGAIVGTPAYMSPEQADPSSMDIDTRTDVYALGVTLYELLTGSPPIDAKQFKRGAVMEMLRMVREVEPPRPSTKLSTADALPTIAANRSIEPAKLAKLLQGELDWVVMKSIEKDRDRRYESALGLARDIQRYLADEVVEARPPSTGYRLKKFVRRHKGQVLAASLVLFVLIGGIIGTTWQAMRAERARANEASQRARAEANFRQARAAVDEYFTTVSESRLLNVPGLQPLRKELLEAASKYYREFLAQHGNDPAVKAEAGSASFRVGWISQAASRPDEALEPYQTAAKLYEELVRNQPEMAEHRRCLATVYGALGMLGLDGDEEALVWHKKALGLRETLVREQPDDFLARSDVARTHRNIGGVFRARGKSEEALAEWVQAVALGQELLGRPAGEAPRGPGLTGRSDLSAIVREDLGNVQLDRASLLRDLGRYVSAEVAWQQARELFEGLARERRFDLNIRAKLADCLAEGSKLQYALGKPNESRQSLLSSLEIDEQLVATNPTVTYYRARLIEGRLMLGHVAKQLGRFEEALEANRSAVEQAERVLADEPSSASFRTLLTQALTQSGNLLLKDGRAEEAVALVRRALEYQEVLVQNNPNMLYHKGTLASVLRGLGRAEAKAGRPAKARAAFDRSCAICREQADRYPGERYNLACALAMMIPVSEPDQRAALAAQAMDALRKCVAAEYANRANLQADTDLDSIRERDDFKNLVAELKK